MTTNLEEPVSARSQRLSLTRRLELTFEKAPFRSVAVPVLLCIGLIAILYAMRSILLPLTFAIMLYFMLRPAVAMLARWRVPRLIGSTLVLGALLAALGFVALELAAPAAAWAEQLPRALHRLEERSRLLAYPLDLVSPLLESAAKSAEEIGADRVLRVAPGRWCTRTSA